MHFSAGPQFHSEDTPATTEAHQILLALQHRQLASNGNNSNFNENKKNSKLPKSLETTKTTFDAKSEMHEQLCTFFPNNSTVHNQLTETDKVN